MISSHSPVSDDKPITRLPLLPVLDTITERDFDEVIQLVSLICEVPGVLLIVTEGDQQHIKAKMGIEFSVIPVEFSFLSHALQQEDLYIQNDIEEEIRLWDNENSYLRFYAGIPLLNSDKQKIGTLCILDRITHHLTEEQTCALMVLARQIVKKLELRQRNDSLTTLLEQTQLQAQKIYHLHEINSRILSVISHDLRSPLNLISGMLSLLSGEARLEADLRAIVEKTSRMLYTTDQMLTTLVQWGATQQAGHELNRVEFNLWDLVEKVRQEQLPMAEDKKNQIVNHITKKTLIYADQEMLRFVLRNLVGNANKFTDAGEISICAQTNRVGIQVIVQDNGKGMSEESMKGLFAQNQTSRGTHGEKGLGFGLIMCRAFIEEHSGKMEVKSQIGKGSCFSFSIPQQ